MDIEDEWDSDFCYTTRSGTPTLTLKTDEKEVMIPWIGFGHAIMSGDRIKLSFQGPSVAIVGENLDELWEELQLQSVRSLRRSSSEQTTGCIIRSLKVVLKKKSKDQTASEENAMPADE